MEPPSGGNNNPDDEATGAAEDPRTTLPPSRPARRAPGATGQSTSVKSPTGARPRVTTASGKSGPRAAVGTASGKSGARSAVPPRAAADGDEESTNVGAPARPPARPASRSVPAVRRAPEPAPEPRMELDDADVRKPLLPPSQPNYNNTYSGTGKIVAPEEVIGDARAFFSELSRSDKTTFAGAVAVIISNFLPWKETALDGEVLGLMSTGVVSLLCAGVIIAAIAVRVRRTMPNLHPLAPWVTQLALSCFCVLFTLVFIRLAFDSTEVPSPIGNRMIENSTPSLGVFIGLLGGLGTLAGSLMGLKERS